MNYSKVGFRGFYKTLTACKLTDPIRPCIKDFPKAELANCILTYGYIDHNAGMTLEVLAAGVKDEIGFRFFDGSDDCRAFIRIQNVENENFALFPDKDGILAKRYQKKIDTANSYVASEEIEKTRNMAFLDSCRDPYYIDDVLVYLIRVGLEPEGCWVRISGLGEHYFIGKLLNEPAQDFGYHLNDTIAFYVKETEDKKVICWSDMTPDKVLTAEDLEDGSMLKNAVTVFNSNKTEDNLFELMQLLRDSFVWVPCNAILSDADQAALEKTVQEAGDDLRSLIGKELPNQDNIRLVPDILVNGDKYYFPIFSSVEEMGEYGSRFSKVQKHMLEVIPLARNNKKNVSGIVLNAYSEPFILDRDLFELVEKMKSRLSETREEKQ